MKDFQVFEVDSIEDACCIVGQLKKTAKENPGMVNFYYPFPDFPDYLEGLDERRWLSRPDTRVYGVIIDNEFTGFFKYSVNNPLNYVSNFSVLAFDPKKFTGLSLAVPMITRSLFQAEGFRFMMFRVCPENPFHNKVIRLFEPFFPLQLAGEEIGTRIVGEKICNSRIYQVFPRGKNAVHLWDQDESELSRYEQAGISEALDASVHRISTEDEKEQRRYGI